MTGSGSGPSARRERRFSVDAEEYPFASHWFERDGAALHYLDEGVGVPVVMLHGNPTWSFLYRNVVKQLDGSCRCIVPDLPGFGFSDHPPGYGYTPQEHAEWLQSLLDGLGLESFVLVVQDWGGPIGLSVATAQPERVRGLVLCNTWCWPPPLSARVFSWVVGGPLAKYFHLHHNLFARTLLPMGISNPKKKTPQVLAAYTAPFPTPESRMGTYVFPRAIRQCDAWLGRIERGLSSLRDKPVEMVWPLEDKAFGSEAFIARWQRHFPAAPVDRVAEANHYIQEDAPERVSDAIERLLGRLAS